MKSKSTSVTDQAAVNLSLHNDDPSLIFYQGVMLFEAKQYKEALEKLIVAAEHNIIHAVPYVEWLTNEKKSKIKVPENLQLRIKDLQIWFGWFDKNIIDNRSFFIVSEQLLVLSTCKESRKKTELRKFNNLALECGHFFYHRALMSLTAKKVHDYQDNLTRAANYGHLLAIALLCKTGKLTNNATTFAVTMTNPTLHKKYQNHHFSKRLFNVTVSDKTPLGKRCYQVECANLGVIPAIAIVAGLYFFQEGHDKDSLPLVAFASLRGEDTARSLLAELFARDPSISLPGFKMTPELILKMLCDNFLGNIFKDPELFILTEELRQRQLVNSVNSLQTILKKYRDLSIHEDSELIEVLEQTLVRLDPRCELYPGIASLLANCHLKRKFSTNNLQERYDIGLKAIHYQTMLLDSEDILSVVIDLFYISKEQVELGIEIKKISGNPEKLECYQKLIPLIDKIEQGLADVRSDEKKLISKYTKFIHYCVDVYCQLKLLDNNNHHYLQTFKVYLDLAAKSGYATYVRWCAMHYIAPAPGFPHDCKHGRELLNTLSDDEKMNHEMMNVLGMSYIFDTPAAPEKLIALYEDNAPKIPMLYWDLGEMFADGYMGIKIDRERARRFYQLALDHGVAHAHIGMALITKEDICYTDDPQEQDRLKAKTVEHYQKAYQDGQADGAFFLGECYLYGLYDLEQDIEKAREYFKIAVERNAHPCAKALLLIIERGYRGEQNISPELELIKLKSLLKDGYLDYAPWAMFEYGVMLLLFDPKEGVEKIVMAADYNNLEASYFVAALQIFIDYKISSLDPSYFDLINKHSFRNLYDMQRPKHLVPMIARIYDFAMLCRQYCAINYTITAEFVLEKMLLIMEGSEGDLADVEQEIKEHFPSHEVAQTRLLIKMQERRMRSGDEECRRHTDALFSGNFNLAEPKVNKFKRAAQSEKLSLHNFSTCLKSFMLSGIKLQGDDKKAVEAAVHIHPMHGAKGKNPHQPLEKGRQQTARAALDVMSEAIEKRSEKHQLHGPGYNAN